MVIEELDSIVEKQKAARKEICIRCCMASGCMSSRAGEIKTAMQQAVTEKHLSDRVEIRRVGCMGLCSQGPMVTVEPQGLRYEHVAVESAPSIIYALIGGKAQAALGDANQPFFSRQLMVVRSNEGRIDPERIEDYLEEGGYRTLHRVLHEMQRPAQVIDAIVKSGLRGRGGAGYPTGLKWGTVAKSAGTHKFVICNGDEGDPGAYMDRSVLESDPHKVLEGMSIAGYAVGADQAYIYVRAEYPLAVSRLQTAIRQAKQHGLLGTGIFESQFNFNVEVRIGAGAFVCGEETALMASIEGGRGQPHPRPPFLLGSSIPMARFCCSKTAA